MKRQSHPVILLAQLSISSCRDACQGEISGHPDTYFCKLYHEIQCMHLTIDPVSNTISATFRNSSLVIGEHLRCGAPDPSDPLILQSERHGVPLPRSVPKLKFDTNTLSHPSKPNLHPFPTQQTTDSNTKCPKTENAHKLRI